MHFHCNMKKFFSLTTLQNITHISQIVLAIVAIFGYFYTVRPIYQKELLSEQIAVKEKESNELKKNIDALNVERNKLLLDITAINDELMKSRVSLDRFYLKFYIKMLSEQIAVYSDVDFNYQLVSDMVGRFVNYNLYSMSIDEVMPFFIQNIKTPYIIIIDAMDKIEKNNNKYGIPLYIIISAKNRIMSIIEKNELLKNCNVDYEIFRQLFIKFYRKITKLSPVGRNFGDDFEIYAYLKNYHILTRKRCIELINAIDKIDVVQNNTLQ